MRSQQQKLVSCCVKFYIVINFKVNLYLSYLMGAGCYRKTQEIKGKGTLKLYSNENFQADITRYDTKIEKINQNIMFIRRYLGLSPSDQQKKTLIEQLAQANLLLKKYNQTRNFIIKEQTNLMKNKENFEMLEIIKRSNEFHKNSDQKLKEAEGEVVKYKNNQEVNVELGVVLGEAINSNRAGTQIDQEIAKLQQEFK